MPSRTCHRIRQRIKYGCKVISYIRGDTHIILLLFTMHNENSLVL